MHHRSLLAAVLTASLLIAACSDAPEQPDDNDDNGDEAPQAQTVRVATFNASLYRDEQGQLADELADPDREQPAQIAEIIQVVRPDVLLVNEFDYDEDQTGVELYADNYLGVPQGEQEAIDYPYYYSFPSNTGVPSGHDLGGTGSVGDEPGTEEYADDAFGYGKFPGQYAFAVYSKYPLELDDARSFQHLLWDDMPNNRIPDDFFSDEAVEILRLSSKNHVDLPVNIDDHRLHLLASHPTPPAFDGDEQRNLRRNHDEVRFWLDYIHPNRADYIYDDDGTDGGLDEDTYFVIAGDLNIDPNDGQETAAIEGLLNSPRTYDPRPTSEGGVVKSEADGGVNDDHVGDPALVTSDWPPSRTGNMRVDYAIPSSNLNTLDSAVFWPAPGEPYADLVEATDHRLVWVDVELGAQ